MRLHLTHLLWIIPATAFAVDPPPLSLSHALAIALEKSPKLASANWDIRVAEAGQIQARLRPNPQAGLRVENFLGSGPVSGFQASETTLELTQLIELGGKRAARIKEASAKREVARLEYEDHRLEVVQEVAETFIEALTAQRRVQLAEDYSKLADEMEPAIKRRVEVGQASALEQARGAVAISSARVALEQANHELDAGRRKLASLWGDREPKFGRLTGDLDRIPELPKLTTLTDKLDSHPKLAQISAERVAREAAVAKEKSAAIPDVTASIGPRWLQNDRNAALVAGISIPLPFRNKNQGAIAAAQALVRKSDSERQAALNDLIGKLGQAWEKLARAHHTLAILTRDVIPQAKLAIEAANAGYASGKFSQLEVLDARRAYGETNNLYLQSLTELHKAQTEIEALTGANFNQTKP